MTRRTILAATLAAALALAACSGGDGNQQGTAAPTTSTATAVTQPPHGTVPDVRGRDLRTAEALLESSGYLNVGTEDASGQARTPIIRRNWQVCSQHPAEGQKADPGTLVKLRVVRVSETCPSGGY